MEKYNQFLKFIALFPFLISLVCCSQTDIELDINYRVFQKIYKDLQYETTIRGYLCTIAPNGEATFISDGIICGESKVFFQSACHFSDTSMKTYIFEGGSKQSYFKPISDESLNIHIPSSYINMSLQEYFDSDIIDACFVKQKLAIESDEKLWVEVILFSKLNTRRLHLLLIYDKQSGNLDHLRRKIIDDPYTSNPFNGCENDRAIYSKFEFPDQEYFFDSLIINK